MENLDEWIDKLKDKIVIVEGIKDERALNNLGVKNVIILNKPLYQIVDDISKKHKKVVILTDLDKKGRELYSKLRFGLERNHVKIDDSFRRFLFKEKISHIEGIKLKQHLL